MIVLLGVDNRVRLASWNGRRVWIAGVGTPWSIVKTYADQVIMVTDSPTDLLHDMTDMYVITNNHSVVADTVVRGGFCMKCSFHEGLWRLQDIIKHQQLT